jgi:hypothetical protein
MKTKYKELKPHEIEDTNVGRIELVSYPWAEDGKIFINAHTTPGDPTTMKTFRITATIDLKTLDAMKSGQFEPEQAQASYIFEEQS